MEQAAALEGMQETSAYLFGRRTYEKMAAFWPDQPDSNPMAVHLNATPKHVATRTLDDAQLTWPGARVLRGDLATAVRGLKADGDGGIAVLGSGVLAQELAALDLVDGYRIMLPPCCSGPASASSTRSRDRARCASSARSPRRPVS